MPAIDIRAQDAGRNLSKGIALIVLAFLCAASYGALSKGLRRVPPPLTLSFQYANNGERHMLNTYCLADRIGATKKIRCHRRPDQRHLVGRIDIAV